ncbi:MAG: zinc-binding dehydrogenase [Gaiellales bacterium]
MEARAAILLPDGELVVDVIDLPDPAPGEVLVRNLATGVCHSQLHQIRSGYPRERAVLLGHEAASEVLAVGEGVTHVVPGDRVLLTWHRRDAKPGDGIPPGTSATWHGEPIGDEYDGIYTWSDHALARQEYVVHAPAEIDPALTCIIGCAVMTGSGAVLNTADVPGGASVAVIGAGGVGLSAIAAAAARGADPVIAVDLDESKLEFARRFGATVGVNGSTGDAVEQVRELTGGGVDFAFDCIGHSATTRQALLMARPGDWTITTGGTAVLVGWPVADAAIDALDVVVGEKQLLGSAGGSCRPERDFPVFYDWHRTGVLDLDALITERWSLDEIGTAVERLASGKVFGRSVVVFDQ